MGQGYVLPSEERSDGASTIAQTGGVRQARKILGGLVNSSAMVAWHLEHGRPWLWAGNCASRGLLGGRILPSTHIFMAPPI